MTRRCAISIDVDSIACYYRIHGLGPAPARLRHVIMHRCVPRFIEILDRRGIQATFFIVAEDVEDVDDRTVGSEVRKSRALVRELAASGHEIGNHSYSHPYQLARMGRVEVAEQIGRAHRLLGGLVDRPVVGFRAPGYDVSAVMLRCLMALGYTYDSSIFPAPGYYAAKAGIMAVLALLGRKSGAVLTDPRALLAPADPYRPHIASPWRRGDAPLVELPIGLTPYARIPAIGTSLLLAPRPLRDHLLRAMRRRVFFNFELHGIDLADAVQDSIPDELVARQPDLRVPLRKKRAALEALLDNIARHYQFATLAEASAALAGQV
ncbi:MAG: polysaccharide deacetylase family protein [Proteobacteria bacterium]|nr:polysaccharide deacetylase family protein [Pseudomonadota bacterium]